LAEEERLWEAKGRAARFRLERDYSFDRVLDSYESLFEELVGGPA
jgi:hypothetical protein